MRSVHNLHRCAYDRVRDERHTGVRTMREKHWSNTTLQGNYTGSVISVLSEDIKPHSLQNNEVMYA